MAQVPEELEKGSIYVKDAEARAMLDQIAEFDSRRTGKVNLTRTIYRVLSEELERIKATSEYRKWKKERGQSC